MGRYLGNNGSFRADISSGADGTTLTEIPYVREISPKTDRPRIDVTAMGDSGAAKLADFPDFELTIQVFDERDSNALQIIGDGVDRLFLWCYDTTATTKKGGYDTGQFSWAPTSKARAAVEGALTVTSSTGDPTFFFAASIPDPT